MNRNSHHTILFSMLALTLGTAAWAHGGGDMFQTLDGNHDGRISAQEHAASVQAMFSRMDANHDGSIDTGEMKAGAAMMHGDHGMRGGMHAMMMDKMDSNHDGVVTASEHASAAKAMFDRMDANHDGKVTTDEMQAGHAAMMGDHAMGDHAMGEHAMGEHKMAGGDTHAMGGMKMDADDKDGMMSRMGEHMRMMDADHDGKITAAEHTAAAQAMFTRMDTDHDGYVSQAEFKAGHAMPKTP